MATPVELPAIEEIRLLRPRKGDTIVVRVPSAISMKVAAEVKDQVRANLAVDDEIPILVLSNGIVMEIVREAVS